MREKSNINRFNKDDDFNKLIFILDISDAKNVLINGLKKFPWVIYALKKLRLTCLRLPIIVGTKIGTFEETSKSFNLD